MRILHTADWHIGQMINGWTRDFEHRTFLTSLADLIEAQGIDALVVAGDVFDGINPSAEATRLLYDALLAFRERRPHLTSIIIAGNHDPAGKLEAPASLLRTIGVHAVGVIHRDGSSLDLDRHLVALRDSSGDVRAYGLAIPYLRYADLPNLQQREGETGSPVVRETRALYAHACAAAREAAEALPLIATGHLHCSGSEESDGAERRILVGGEHAVPHDIFPDDLAYVALGHLHKAQRAGRDHVRYSGSPFPLSATELPYQHGVTLVELNEGSVRHEHIRIARPVPCHRVPETGAARLSSLTELFAGLPLDPDCPEDRRPFVHLVVEPEGPAAGLIAEADQLVGTHPVRCASIKIERPASSIETATVSPGVTLAECDPLDLFVRAFQDVHGTAPEDAHRTAFAGLQAEV